MTMTSEKKRADIAALIDKKLAPLRREIKSLRADFEAIEDAASLRLIETAPDEAYFPLEVVKRLIDGENKIKVYREYRGLTQAALADAAGTSDQYISQIERGEREPGKKLLARLVAALRVDEEDLR
ncbi:MAG: helix-turn-helix transcriptional regulator [Amphiplicatus sp.]